MLSQEKREKLVRLSEVQTLTGLSRFDVFSTPGFPKPQKRGVKVLGWDRMQVEQWIRANRL